mgnify:CR=1 FL=1|jgi:hypothetical protein
MARTLQGLQWLFYALYAAAGAVALLIATPAGLKLLGQPHSLLTFLPAKILGLPWSLPLWFMDDGPITALAVLGICYSMNLGVGMMLAKGARG